MHRWRAAAVGIASVGLPAAALVLLASSPAGASGISVRVSPSRGLVDGQSVTISGRGLARTYAGKPLTWFVAECTATVRGRMNPSTDTPHCDVTEAKAIRLSSHDTFVTHFHVETGIVGDGYCGSDGHDSCVISVGNAHGQGTVIHITFRDPSDPAPSTTSSTTSTTADTSTMK